MPLYKSEILNHKAEKFTLFGEGENEEQIVNKIRESGCFPLSIRIIKELPSDALSLDEFLAPLEMNSKIGSDLANILAIFADIISQSEEITEEQFRAFRDEVIRVSRESKNHSDSDFAQLLNPDENMSDMLAQMLEEYPDVTSLNQYRKCRIQENKNRIQRVLDGDPEEIKNSTMLNLGDGVLDFQGRSPQKGQLKVMDMDTMSLVFFEEPAEKSKFQVLAGCKEIDSLKMSGLFKKKINCVMADGNKFSFRVIKFFEGASKIKQAIMILRYEMNL